jgi:type II secretory pathway pseudopilin PulG
MKTKKAQIWVETVLYTLIGLALMALVLAFAMPKINESRDKALVEQSINSLRELDSKVQLLFGSVSGNVRKADLTLKRGDFYIDGESDILIIVLNGLESLYSEEGEEIRFENILVLSEEDQKTYTTTLKIDYGGKIDIKYSGADEKKKFTPASVPYNFVIENEGEGVIDFREVSGSVGG